MKANFRIGQAVIASVAALASVPAQADIIKHAVRLGAYPVNLSRSSIALTNAGAAFLTFSGSGVFTIWYTAECVSTGFVAVEIVVDGLGLEPAAGNVDAKFCDASTRGAMQTVTGRTVNLASGTHKVEVRAVLWEGAAYLSDSSLLIGK